ncbi:AEC family transporter [Kozakia baliensis]|uniref:AEC family transporter n=1 Tax=Kozakia baliensis TaxID=153496 RepID=UPI001F01EF6C|nr:AEC family transporter [Kozakia baliensis]
MPAFLPTSWEFAYLDGCFDLVMTANLSLGLTIVVAILPILVTLAIGFLAGYRRDFDVLQAGTLIRLVMLYALPLTLTASILSTPRSQILAAGPIAVLILLAMVGGYFAMLGFMRFIAGRPLNEATILAFAVSDPAVPFIGIPVLGQLFGSASALPVSVASLIMNLFLVPLTMVLLSGSHSPGDDASPTIAHDLKTHLGHAVREPVVWAPLASLIAVLGGFHLPLALRSSLLLLGHATGGVALFASGVVLYSRQMRFSPIVLATVATRNILVPALIFLLAVAGNLPKPVLQESTLTMAIPTASISVVLAMRYRVLERETASILFFGTLSSLITMSFFIWITGV